MNIGVIFAGGVGTRMHSKERPKQFLDMYNKPIIIHTLEYFEENEEIDATVVVCVKEWIPYLEKLLFKFRVEKVKKIVEGGMTGQLSIYKGLLAATDLAKNAPTIVLIHDGVRPLIDAKLLSENIECVKRYGSSITSAIVKETIIVTDSDGKIEQVLPRDKSRVAKAPQSFWLNDIMAVHKKALKENKTEFIDSCTLMKYYGYDMHMIDGPYENIKITAPEDFYTMRALLEAKENSQIYELE